MQVYADFSGYTDVAIERTMLLGFTLPKNFNSPYKASSVADFWRRWHLSLSTWLRDYLYIPLGKQGRLDCFLHHRIYLLCIHCLDCGRSLVDAWLGCRLRHRLYRYAQECSRSTLGKYEHQLNADHGFGRFMARLIMELCDLGTLNGVGLVVYKNPEEDQPLGGPQ